MRMYGSQGYRGIQYLPSSCLLYTSPHYETDKDAVYMPRQKDFEHYHDYVQETLRQIVSATGHQPVSYTHLGGEVHDDGRHLA